MAELSSQTLHIVARELNAELNEARAALETFGDQQENVALLRRCGEHLHAVHGALRVSEVYGAALLAEEMGQVVKYLVDNFAEKRHLVEGLDALMRSMVQLPTYLERVMSGGRDMALVLLPLLNDLRAVRGHALLSEGTLLLLNLSSDQQASPAASVPGEGVITVSQWARKLRTRFQLGLLGWIKGERIDQNLETLSRTAEKLEQVATTQPVFQLWWVVGAVLEAMREGGLEGSASIKRLLGQADREMRRLYEQGESRYAEAPSLDLLNNLLYYIARSKTSGPRVAAVRASFRLNELLPVDDSVEQARESLSAPSVKLMKTVAAAIKEDLGRVKDALDIFVRRGGTQVEELAPQLELLKKIGDTLGVLGLGDLRDKVQTETTDLQAMVVQHAPVNEGTLLRMASTLIKVEDSLDEQLVGMIVPTADPRDAAPAKPSGPDEIEFRQVTEAVLRECIVNMARIKEAVAQSMDKSREGQSIDQIPALVRGIKAGLLMLGKNRAAEIMDGIDSALAQFVRSDGLTLPFEAVDRLADAIVAVEYYMETLQAGRADPWYMLDNAETCLKYLAETQPVPRDEAYASVDHAHTIVIEPLSQTVASPTEHERTAVLDRSAPAPKPAAPKPAPVAAASAPPPAAMVKPTDREIDPEFLELFIEEAKDEIEKLKRLFPLWDQNPQDQESLVNIRRSFHTLKGSGRMVGAQLIGEFAWSVESLLNRVINKTLDRTPDMMGLLRASVAAVPELVEQLETGRHPTTDVGRLMSQANAMSGVRPNPMPTMTTPSAPPKAAAAPAIPVVNEVAQKKTLAPPMDPALHEIYAKETAGHLATIRRFISACTLATPPYVVTEDLYRSCHTLSGTAKTAGARQGTKIAEPLNRYVRKLYDNSAGLSSDGLDALKDAVAAIQQVVDHINEDTGYFLNHTRVIARLNELEHVLDQQIARLAETMDVGVEATHAVPVLKETRQVSPPVMTPAQSAPPVESDITLGDDENAITNVFDAEEFPFPTTNETVEVIELPSTDAGELQTLEWAYANFPSDPQVTPDAPSSEGISVEFGEFEPQLDAPSSEGILVEESTILEQLDESAFASEGFEVHDIEELAETNRVPMLRHEDQPVQAPIITPATPESDLEAQLAESFAHDAGEIEVAEVPLDEASEGELTYATELFGADDSETVRSPAIEVIAPQAPQQAVQVEDQPLSATPAIAVQPATPQVPAPAAAASAAKPAPAPAAVHVPVEVEESDEDFDPDVAAIFSEEASELLETAQSSLSSWERDLGNKALVFELKRVLHTLKGGARMAGIRAMGDLSHELETLMELVEAGQVAGDQPVFDALQTSIDALHRMRDSVSQGGRCVRPRELISRIRVLSGHEQPAPVTEEPAAPVVLDAVAPVEVAAPVIEVPEAPVQQYVEPQAQFIEEPADIEVEFGAEELIAAAPESQGFVQEIPTLSEPPPAE
ncbi:MAG: Hpt domain-containing protein, partial [Povalibacter sp.]